MGTEQLRRLKKLTRKMLNFSESRGCTESSNNQRSQSNQVSASPEILITLRSHPSRDFFQALPQNLMVKWMAPQIFSQDWGVAKGQSKLTLKSTLAYNIFCSYSFLCAPPIVFYEYCGGSHHYYPLELTLGKTTHFHRCLGR